MTARAAPRVAFSSLVERGMMDEDGELDLVGRVKGNEGLVVVEVRARKEGGMLTPREAVDFKKQQQVVKTAQRLLRRKGFYDVLRFDIVGVYLNDRDEKMPSTAACSRNVEEPDCESAFVRRLGAFAVDVELGDLMNPECRVGRLFFPLLARTPYQCCQW